MLSKSRLGVKDALSKYFSMWCEETKGRLLTTTSGNCTIVASKALRNSSYKRKF